MRILIVEDEKPAARRLTQLLLAKLPDAHIEANLDTISATVDWLSSHPEPDLIFLDIQLADGISFVIFDQIKINAPIIFCTAYDQYAIKAFKFNSIDYLLKPIDPDELSQAIDKFLAGKKEPVVPLDLIRQLIQVQKTYKTRFLVKLGERIIPVEAQDIAFFYSEDKVTLLQTRTGKKYIVDFTLDEIEDMVSPELFFRLNRKYLSALHSIREVFTYSNSRLKIHLENSTDNDILVSREKMGAFKVWLGQ